MARILADTNEGISTREVFDYCNKYASTYNKKIKHTSASLAKEVLNNAQSLRENLACFELEQ